MDKTRSHLSYKFLIIYFFTFFIHISSSFRYSQPNIISSQPSSSRATNQINHIAYPQSVSTKPVSLYTSQPRPCGQPNAPDMFGTAYQLAFQQKHKQKLPQTVGFYPAAISRASFSFVKQPTSDKRSQSCFSWLIP